MSAFQVRLNISWRPRKLQSELKHLQLVPVEFQLELGDVGV
jgi:hypothetical protein